MKLFYAKKKLLYCFTLFFLITSCQKDQNCIGEVLGIYSGNCSSNIGTFQGEISISRSSTGTQSLLIQDGILDDTRPVYDADISPSCNTITVPLQSVILSSGLAGQISGSFQLNGNSLTGNLNVTVGSGGTVCSYNLTKR